MDTSKTVDVVMCTCNGERYLREQLDSIIGQTYPIHRLIVQDDRSTDGTVAIVREYAARYPFISLYVNGRNLGYNLNFKSAVMRATADFVAISDQDDVWFADKIARQVEAIGGHNICFSAHVRGSRLEGARRVEPQHSLKALLFHGFAGHTMLLRRDYVQREGAWLDCIIYDWSLALNAYFYRDKAITYIAEPLNWHRTHPDEAARRVGGGPSVGAAAAALGPLAPYVVGYRHYRQLQHKAKWRRLYTHVCAQTASDALRTEHTMARCMLSPGALPLLRLCLCCMRHRRSTYYNKAKAGGLMGAVRGFFYPLIFAYRNSDFDD